MSERHSLFDTAFGTCGIAWSDAGVMRMLLPAPDPAALSARLARRGEPGEPPAEVAAAIGLLRHYFAGEPVDFGDVAVDFGATAAFDRAIYAATRRVGYGETATYGSLAAAVGVPGAARAVGRAMGANPVPVIVPCHRVLAAGNRIGGFSAPGGTDTKLRLLRLEGVDPGVLAGAGQLAFTFPETEVRLPSR